MLLLLLLGLSSCFPLIIEALPFVSTWTTTQANETIWLPTINPQSAMTIEWGDSTPSDIVPAGVAVDLNHTYDLPGPYNVSVNGQFRWLNAGTPTREKLAQIVSWGGGFLIDQDSEGAFYGYPNLQISAPPDTQPVFLPGASLRHMFAGGTPVGSPLHWDLKNVTDLSWMFESSAFNHPLAFRNTQGVTTTAFMFYSAPNFNQPFHFDASGLLNASRMFALATAFNQVVNLTNSRKLTSVAAIFSSARSFNQPVHFNTDSVTTMLRMFLYARRFNQPVNFNTSQVTDMSEMFWGATDFNQPIVMDTANVVNMYAMFEDATSFASTISFTSTANATVMRHMFKGATWFDQDLSSWDTDQVAYCEEFCPWCGLPNFTSCSPCFPRYTNEVNLTICSSGSRTPTPAPTTSTPTTSTPTTPAPSTAAPTTSTPSTAAPSSSAVSAAATADHGGLQQSATIVAVAAVMAMWQ